MRILTYLWHRYKLLQSVMESINAGCWTNVVGGGVLTIHSSSSLDRPYPGTLMEIRSWFKIGLTSFFRKQGFRILVVATIFIFQLCIGERTLTPIYSPLLVSLFLQST